MQDMFKDNGAITYALVHIIIGLLAVGAIWIIMGVIIDEFNVLSNGLAATGGIWGAKTQSSLLTLNNIWNKILWLIVLASFIFGLVTAIRKERSGYDG